MYLLTRFTTLKLLQRTRELLLGESPEVFDVYGYDKEGNICIDIS